MSLKLEKFVKMIQIQNAVVLEKKHRHISFGLPGLKVLITLYHWHGVAIYMLTVF